MNIESVPIQDGSLQCPTCKAIYGEKTGTQPPGKMEYHVIPHCLPGYPEAKTIRIVYDIPAGLQVTTLISSTLTLIHWLSFLSLFSSIYGAITLRCLT